MNVCQDQSLQELVDGALARLPGLVVRRQKRGSATLVCGQAQETPMAMAISNDGWLQIRASVASGHIHDAAVPRCAWELLSTNGNLRGAAKIVLVPGQRVIGVVRDLWLEQSATDDDPESAAATVAAMVDEAIHDVDEVQRRLSGKQGCAERCVQSTPPPPAIECDLFELCQLAGWPCNRRAGGQFAVPLDLPGAYALAILRCQHRVSATVELPIGTNISPVARQAVGTFLLDLAGHVRWVRPTNHVQRQCESAVLEVQIDGKPCAATLHHALATLSVAARLSMHELPALADDEIAQKYLSIRGWSS